MNQADTIRRKLREIEAANQVKILYAVESGSRAWGFASPDSDYDVRYVFIRPIKDYLRIYPLPDHIDGPLDEVQDYSGWDIRKALGLLGKSNPSLIEWLHSPIVYAHMAKFLAGRTGAVEKVPVCAAPVAVLPLCGAVREGSACAV